MEADASSGASVSVRRSNKPVSSVSAMQVLEEQDEEYTVIPPVRCKCMRVRSEYVKYFYRLVREKKPTETIGDVLDTMKMTTTCCRDYFINLPRLTMGIMRSGDATIIKKGDRAGERIDPHFPSRIVTDPKKYIIYDKWFPVPPDPSTKKTAKKEIRSYFLTPQQPSKNRVADYRDLYELWRTELYELFRVWCAITFPGYSPSTGGNLELLQGAFFMELCRVVSAVAADEDYPQDLLEKLSRDLLFDEVIEGQMIDTLIEDRQNVYLFFRRVDETQQKTIRSTLMVPTKDGTMFFYFNDDSLMVKISPRQAGELVRDVIIGNTETAGIVVGDMTSLEGARIYARREKFRLFSEADVRLLIGDLKARVNKRHKEFKSEGNVGMENELAENTVALTEIETAMAEKLTIWNQVKAKSKEDQEEDVF